VPAKKAPRFFAIGEFAAAVGVSTDTIRIWERRYGSLKPIRLPSGHRRYTPEQLRWMRRVVAAVASGHRPAEVMQLGEEGLELLTATVDRHSGPLSGWIERVREFDADALADALRHEHRRRGGMGFASLVAQPLLASVREAAAAGDLEARHEHFIREVLQDVLRGARTALGTLATGPRLLICTLGGPSTEIPRQTAALIATEKGLRVRLLGRDASIEDTLLAASEMDLDGVHLPIALEPVDTRKFELVRRLQRSVRPGVHVCLGWPGLPVARRVPRGISVTRKLSTYELWLRRLLGAEIAAQHV
jgi:MerR family transcriptional regulator, light-induced transcriptional regulator